MSGLTHQQVGETTIPWAFLVYALFCTLNSLTSVYLLPPAIDSGDIQVVPIVSLVIPNPCVGVGWLLG